MRPYAHPANVGFWVPSELAPQIGTLVADAIEAVASARAIAHAGNRAYTEHKLADAAGGVEWIHADIRFGDTELDALDRLAETLMLLYAAVARYGGHPEGGRPLDLAMLGGYVELSPGADRVAAADEAWRTARSHLARFAEIRSELQSALARTGNPCLDAVSDALGSADDGNQQAYSGISGA